MMVLWCAVPCSIIWSEMPALLNLAYMHDMKHKVHIEHLHPIMIATHLHGGLSRNIDDLTKSKQVAFNC